MLPNFHARKSQNWRQQSHHSLTDAPDRSLRRAASLRKWSIGVEPILDDVEIKRTQLNHAEMVHALVNPVESKLVIPFANVTRERPGLPKHVLIQHVHPFERHGVGFRIEIVQVSK